MPLLSSRKKKIKFVEIYGTFSEEEVKQFRLFISSRLFGDGRNYDDILSFLESGKSQPQEPGKPKMDQTIWNRLSELTKLAERFLVFKSTERASSSYELLLLKEFKRRNLNTYFEHQFSSSKKLSQLSASNPNEFLEFNKLYLDYLKSISEPKEFKNHYRKTTDYWIASFLLELLDRLIQLMELKTIKTITAKIYLEDLFYSLNHKNIITFIRKNVPDIFPLVAFHYAIYNSLNEPSNYVHYETAKMIFNTKLKLLPEEYRSKLYSYLMECNISLLNTNDSTANLELFKIMDQKLKEGLFSDIQTRSLSQNMFRDYILVGIALKKFKWTENFINVFGQKLPDEFRDSSIFLGSALLMFHKKNFSQCLEYLNKATPVGTFQYVDLSVLKLKVKYELEDMEGCYNELRRLNEYLRKERRVSEILMKFAKDFCVSYNLLLKLRQQPTEKNLYNLSFELAKGNTTGRRWIKNKIKELKISS
jgi:hypothetical protein